jgi:glucan 1,3-beta-glucosidase
MVSLWEEEPRNYELKEMDEFQVSAAYRGYASAQLLSFEKYAGWFFWTYRTETRPEWCYRDCVDQGFIPDLGRPEQLALTRFVLEWARNQAA